MLEKGVQISRRSLIRNAALGTTGFALTPPFSTARELAPASSGIAPAKPFEFDEATISDLQARMKSGGLTARLLTEAYLSRIAEIDDDCSRTHCMQMKKPGL